MEKKEAIIKEKKEGNRKKEYEKPHMVHYDDLRSSTGGVGPSEFL